MSTLHEPPMPPLSAIHAMQRVRITYECDERIRGAALILAAGYLGSGDFEGARGECAMMLLLECARGLIEAQPGGPYSFETRAMPDEALLALCKAVELVIAPPAGCAVPS